MLSVKKIVWGLAVMEILIFSMMAYRLLYASAVSVRFSVNSYGCMEVFYAQNFDFTGKQRAEAFFRRGKNYLTITIPRGEYKTLRLDPGTGSGYEFTITEVVWSPNDFMRHVISGEDLARCRRDSNTILIPEKSGAFHFKTQSEDPQIFIDLRQAVPHWTIPLNWILLVSGAFLVAVLLMLAVVRRKVLAMLCDAINRKLEAWRVRHTSCCRVLRSGYCWWWCLFFVCVVCGFTFASLGVIRSNCDVELRGETKLLGRYRTIRTDEFVCHLLPSIEQFSQNFPLKSMRKGLSGRNYLIFHDTGIPVWHPVLPARPATWGYFLFDLRRGISWHSMFPFFFAVFTAALCRQENFLANSSVLWRSSVAAYGCSC